MNFKSNLPVTVQKSFFVILFVLIAVSQLMAAVNDTISISKYQMEGYIKINDVANTENNIYDSVTFGNSFSITIFVEFIKDCLCEDGSYNHFMLRIHNGSGTITAVCKSFSDSSISDTLWSSAERIPGSTKTLDTVCRYCEDTTRFFGNELGILHDHGLMEVMKTKNIISSKSLKAILYIRDSKGRLFKLQCTGFEKNTEPGPGYWYESFSSFTIHWEVAKEGSDVFDDTGVLVSKKKSIAHRKVETSYYDLNGRTFNRKENSAVKGIVGYNSQKNVMRLMVR